MRVELAYMQHNINDSQALLWCSVFIILEMASLDALFLFLRDSNLCFFLCLFFFFFFKTKGFVLRDLFLYKKRVYAKTWFLGWINIYKKERKQETTRESHPYLTLDKILLRLIEGISFHLLSPLVFTVTALKISLFLSTRKLCEKSS